jgi:hypothetical protein
MVAPQAHAPRSSGAAEALRAATSCRGMLAAHTRPTTHSDSCGQQRLRILSHAPAKPRLA